MVTLKLKKAEYEAIRQCVADWYPASYEEEINEWDTPAEKKRKQKEYNRDIKTHELAKQALTN